MLNDEVSDKRKEILVLIQMHNMKLAYRMQYSSFLETNVILLCDRCPRFYILLTLFYCSLISFLFLDFPYFGYLFILAAIFFVFFVCGFLLLWFFCRKFKVCRFLFQCTPSLGSSTTLAQIIWGYEAVGRWYWYQPSASWSRFIKTTWLLKIRLLFGGKIWERTNYCQGALTDKWYH